MHISKLFSYINAFSSQSTIPIPNKPNGFCGRKATLDWTVHKTNPYIDIHTQTSNTHF